MWGRHFPLLLQLQVLDDLGQESEMYTVVKVDGAIEMTRWEEDMPRPVQFEGLLDRATQHGVRSAP